MSKSTFSADEIAERVKVAVVESINSILSNSPSCSSNGSRNASRTAPAPVTSILEPPAHFTSTQLLPLNRDNSDDDFEMEKKRPHMEFALPSYLGQRCVPKNHRGLPLKKRKKTERYALREFICLPEEMLDNVSHDFGIAIPRGESRNLFAQYGLIAKINVGMSWDQNKMEREVGALFVSCFCPTEEKFKFEYLATYAGTKILRQPKVSKGFLWDAKSVLAIARKTIYILVAKQFHVIKIDKKETESGKSSSVILKQGSSLQSENKEEAKMDIVLDHSDFVATLYNEYINILPNEGKSSDDDDIDISAFVAESSISNEDNIWNEETYDLDKENVIKDCLLQLRENIDNDEVNYFNVNRQNILDGVLRALKRKSFKPNGRLSVRFSDDAGGSEGAVDAGGPTRELLRLLMDQIRNSVIFEGNAENKFITRCQSAISSDLYFMYGQLIALSVIHGGPAPKCFSRILVSQLLEHPRDFETVESIGEDNIKRKIEQIKDSMTMEDLQKNVEESEDFLTLCGAPTFAKKFSDKDVIVKTAIKFYSEDRCIDCINRFKLGLNTMNFLDFVKAHPVLLDLFKYTNQEISRENLDSIFQIKFSENGSNERMKENAVIAFWRDFLLDLEDKIKDGSSNLTISDIVVFATGAKEIPPGGFDPLPKLCFTNDSRFPLANTCANILQLPLCHNKYEEFCYCIEFGILNSPGFGIA